MNLEEEFRERAEEGDGAFAIALALLRLADAVRALGVADAATPMGAIEFLGARIDAAATQIVEAIQQF